MKFWTSVTITRQSIRKNSDRIKLLKQTVRDAANKYKCIGGYDMAYYEFREACREACSEKFIYFCICMTRKKNEGKNRILNESSNTYFECKLETEAFFSFFEWCVQLKTGMIWEN